MLEKINELKSAIESLSAKSKDEVEALRIKYLSKKGEVSALFNDFRNVPNEQKREIGQKLNELKNLATEKINSLREAVESGDSDETAIDLSRTASPIELGTRHPISLIRNEIISILLALSATASAQRLQPAPRLVVNITIDQLRTDYIQAFAPLYGPDGFKKLLSEGRVYEAASYDFLPIDLSYSITEKALS